MHPTLKFAKGCIVPAIIHSSPTDVTLYVEVFLLRDKPQNFRSLNIIGLFMKYLFDHMNGG